MNIFYKLYSDNSGVADSDDPFGRPFDVGEEGVSVGADVDVELLHRPLLAKIATVRDVNIAILLHANGGANAFTINSFRRRERR